MKKIFLILLVVIESVFSQTLSDDFFPLSIGNSWVYNYSTLTQDLVNGWSFRDSGTAIYNITSRTITNDSTIWQFQEIRNLINRSSQGFPPQQTTIDTIKDTSEFSIAEYHVGNHRLIRTGNQELFSVFPLTEEFQDTALFFRYFPLVNPNTFSVSVQSLMEPNYKYDISFRRSIGITKLSFYIDPPLVGYDASTNHTLLSSVITSIDELNVNPLPKDFKLYQNFPNPFNPVTKIRYTIPTRISTEVKNFKVSLKVFDILGNEIAVLVNEEKSPGEYEVALNGSNLTSGIYFYELKTSNMKISKKCLLLK